MLFFTRNPFSYLFKFTNFHLESLRLKLDTAGVLSHDHIRWSLVHVFVIMEIILAHNKDCLGRV